MDSRDTAPLTPHSNFEFSARPMALVEPLSCAAIPGIDNLPDEILILIFSFLSASAPVQSLRACLLCCKAWQALALPNLYRDLHFDKFTPHSFRFVPASSLALVRSLSITLQLLELTYEPLDGKRDGYFLTIENLDGIWYYFRFPRDPHSLFKDMKNLKSFSLSLKGEEPHCAYARVWPPAELIYSILRNLPSTCISLELDIPSFYATRDQGPGLHVCRLLTSIIPRLQNLRLAIPHICPDLLGPYPELFSAPFLTDAVINCFQSFLCEAYEQVTGIVDKDDPTAKVLTEALLTAVKRAQIPAIRRLLVLTKSDFLTASPFGDEICPALLKRDLLEWSLLAMPYFNLNSSNLWDKYCVLRPTSVDEFVSNHKSLLAFAEGEPWKELYAPSGCRLPTKMVSDCEFVVPKPLTLGTREDFSHVTLWRGRHWNVWDEQLSVEDATMLVPVTSGFLYEDILLQWPMRGENSDHSVSDW